MLKVSVIIPVFNAEKTIIQNLNAIKHQQMQTNSFEIIAVNDGSTDSTMEKLNSLQDIIVISQPNRGPAAARNAGAKQASGEILVFTDSDTIPQSDWLNQLTVPFKNSFIMAAAGTYSIANKESKLATLIHEEIEYRHNQYKEFIKFAGTYNLAVRKSLFDKIGGFNETYRQASGEDNDLCYKILREGFQIKFVPQAKVAHYHTENLVKYLQEQYRHGYWRALLYYKFPERMTGDSYTMIKDGTEIILCYGTFLCVLSGQFFRKRAFNKIALISFLSIMAWQIKFAMQVCNQSRNIAYSTMVFSVRALARSFGLMVGLCSQVLTRLLRIQKAN